MIRGFFSLVFKLIALAFLVFVGTVIWLVYDGLTDQGDHADVAVVLGNGIKRDGEPGQILRERLDRAVELFEANKFPLIIVSGATRLGGYDEAKSMAQYLERHAVPVEAIIEDHQGANTDETSRSVAAIMRARNLHSVMIVTHYYHITRTKLSLDHVGISDIKQAHVGTVHKGDVFAIEREVAGIYYYLFKFYILPAAEKAKVQAVKEGDKLKADAQVEADKVKAEAAQKLDSIKK
jgi:vancomycin permeability regulator SanA